MEKIPLVKEKENSIIISGFLVDFLQVKFFHCGVSHQCPVGSTHWVIVGGVFYIQSVFINLIAVCISKKDVLQRV